MISAFFLVYVSFYSIASSSPIWWVIEGPGIVRHNFADDFCEIKLKMTIHNSSDVTASIHISTFDSAPNINSLTSGASVPSANEAGWRDLSVLNDIKVTSDSVGNHIGKLLSPLSVSPFIWSGSSSNQVKLGPLSFTEIAFQICVFSPGTYDVSNYSLHWNLLTSGDQEDIGADSRQSSGTCHGHSYYVTVLQQD